jgi:hypothetical protein
MREDTVDIWTEPADAICITTNGFIKKNGSLVMGAGVAGQAQARYPGLPYYWGDCVFKWGQGIWAAEMPDGKFLLSFPVKHNWYEEADLTLIERSAKQLQEYVDGNAGFEKVLLPRPGCGNGRLTWAQVKPVIEPILDDRIVVVRSPW